MKIFFIIFGIILGIGILGEITMGTTTAILASAINKSQSTNAFNFSLSADPSSGTVVQGDSISTAITATLLSGRSKTVNFIATGLPQNTAAFFSASSCNPTCSSTLTITTTQNTPVGNYTVTVTAVSGKLSRTAAYTLTVTAPVLDTVIVVPANEQVLSSFDFETGSGTTPFGWTTDAWKFLEAEFQWENNLGYTGSRSIGMTLNTANDARWVYNINLQPRNAYKLVGHIKGENIVNQEGGAAGANLNVGDWERTDDMTGTFDWTKISLIFPVPYAGTTAIRCRLGFYGNAVTGKSWCDDLILISNPLTKHEGAHTYSMLEPSDLTAISETNMKQWILNLDKAYTAYADLVGGTPSNGEKIGILSVTKYPGGWAVAGNPIKWMQTYIKDELTSINNNGDWSFGILHELGHDFDWPAWNWDAELWANTKMYYAIEDLNGKVKGGGIYYVGSELKNYYQTDAAGSYDKTLKLGVYSGDGLTYKFIYIKDQIGLEPFRQTFRYFLTLSQEPATRLDKFNLFLDKLTEYSSVNVRDMFPSIEMNAITAELSK